MNLELRDHYFNHDGLKLHYWEWGDPKEETFVFVHGVRDQGRSWDDFIAAMIARGLFHLMQSTAGDKISEYHLQAGIAACHCAAKDYGSTDWPQILSLYDRLVEMNDSAVILLNRAVALANVHGPKAGIEAVQAIQNRQELTSYYLLYAVLGEFEADLNNKEAAANYFRKSLELTTIKSGLMQQAKPSRIRRLIDR